MNNGKVQADYDTKNGVSFSHDVLAPITDAEIK